MSFITHSSNTSSKLSKKGATKFHWHLDNWQYIFITMAYTITIVNFKGFSRKSHAGEDPTILHYIIGYVFVGLPFTYLQVLMGQYTQLGPLFFKHMSPLGHGIGYTCLLITFALCCNFGLRTTDLSMYLLGCADPIWLKCPSDSSTTCWSTESNCKRNNCINRNISLSTYTYWLNYTGYNEGDLSYNKAIYLKVIPLGFCWILIFLLMYQDKNKFAMIRLSHNIGLMILAVLFFVSLLSAGSAKGVSILFQPNLSSLVSTKAWARTIIQVIKVLSLSTVGHVTYGSYMDPSMPSGILSASSVFFNFVATLMATTILHASIGIIMYETGTEEDNIEYIWQGEFAFYLIIIPEAIAFVGVPRLWSMLYFIGNILIVLSNIISHLDSIESSLSDAHSIIRIYRKYVMATICIIGMLVGSVTVSSYTIFHRVNYFYSTVIDQAQCMVTFLMCFFACWIYRAQRICDDIHFLHGSQPTRFWKILWYALPVPIGLTCFYYHGYNSDKPWLAKDYVWFHIFTYSLIICPIPILIVHQIFCYLKNHNLVGILIPEERWGPPDPEERHLRHLFNPRQEIRSRRRDDTCHHNCLLRNKYVAEIASAEREQRAKYFRLLETNNISTAPSDIYKKGK